MSEKFDHKKIEKKWQEVWAKTGLYKTDEDTKKPKFYALDMFPYPSGEGLHVGHPKGYIATDIFSRLKKMQGFRVLHPMGWDAFGLPAENYALKHKIHPSKAVEENIKTFKRQLNLLGFNYDWDREIKTTDPEYYKWTQWIFLKLYEKGLAYESNEPIIWCPSCKTGLSQEDLEAGKCERCGSEVEMRPMRQWVLKMTDYADRLLADLDLPEVQWEEQIKEQQRNWIGKSEGAEVEFRVSSSEFRIKVFTTRPDTLFGATFMILAPEHELVQKITTKEQQKAVQKYVEATKKKTELQRQEGEKSKTGVFTGAYAINPVNGEEIPIWIADYVLASYGHGAIMAVPAHDERDFAFAKKFDLPVKQVVAPSLVDDGNPPQKGKENTKRKMALAIVYDPKTKRYLTLKWKKQPWVTFITGGVEGDESYLEAIQREITEETGYKNFKLIRSLGLFEAFFFAAHKDVNRQVLAEHFLFELTDDEKLEVADEEKAIHEVQWLTAKELEKTKINHAEFVIDWKNIQDGHYIFTGEGISVNSQDYNGLSTKEAKEKIVADLAKEGVAKKTTQYRMRDWVFSRQRYWGEPIPIVHCQKCGTVPVPESELPLKLPEVESYQPTETGESPLANITDWVNTKCPKCGGAAKRETNTMPQWAGSSWYYLRYIDPKNGDALVDKNKEKSWMPVDLYVGGIEHATRHLLYARFWHKFLYDIDVVSTTEPFKRLIHVGLIAAEDGRKMSKRWGNVINPDDIVAEFGADALRLYEMFMGPFTMGVAWSTKGLIGVRRFLDRYYGLAMEVVANKDKVEAGQELVYSSMEITETAILKAVMRAVKKVGEDIEEFKFNTAVSSMMEALNELYDLKKELAPADSPRVWFEAMTLFNLVLAPFAPFMTEEVWSSLGFKESIHVSNWPKYVPELISEDVVEIAVQVNGKVRGTISVSTKSIQDEVLKEALENENIQKHIGEAEIKKVIYVPSKILNIVI